MTWIKYSVGCKVKVYDVEFEEEMEFKIVGSTEANSLEGKIFNESPVGKALIGARKGETVSVEKYLQVLWNIRYSKSKEYLKIPNKCKECVRKWQNSRRKHRSRI